MKNDHTNEKQDDASPLTLLSNHKRLSHLSGIEMVRKGKIPANIQKETEIYDLSSLPRFTLCACYLGYVNYRLFGEEYAEIPIYLIWDLFNYASVLTVEKQIMDRHMMMISKAMELFGRRADISVKDRYIVDGISKKKLSDGAKMKCIGFDEKGITPDVFSQMLMHALRRDI